MSCTCLLLAVPVPDTAFLTTRAAISLTPNPATQTTKPPRAIPRRKADELILRQKFAQLPPDQAGTGQSPQSNHHGSSAVFQYRLMLGLAGLPVPKMPHAVVLKRNNPPTSTPNTRINSKNPHHQPRLGQFGNDIFGNIKI